MKLTDRKTASVSNIWSPNRRAKAPNPLKKTEFITFSPLRLVGQRIVQSKPFASLEESSLEVMTTPEAIHSTSTVDVAAAGMTESSSTVATETTETTETTKTTGEQPTTEVMATETTESTSTTTGLWPETPMSTTTATDVVMAVNSDEGGEVFDIEMESSPTPLLVDDDVELMQLIDELPDMDSSSLDTMVSAKLDLMETTTTEKKVQSSTTQTSTQLLTTTKMPLINPLSGLLVDDEDDVDVDIDGYTAVATSTDANQIKAKRAIGNEQHLPIGNAIRPAPRDLQPVKLPTKPGKPNLVEFLHNETSAERAERIQKGIQRLMHFITIVGHVDSYLTKRFRTGIKNIARLYDSKEMLLHHQQQQQQSRQHPPQQSLPPHLLPLTLRHRRRIDFDELDE